jgi:hypothetical protein
LTADIDPQRRAGRFRIGGNVFVLNESEWSGWIRAGFGFSQCPLVSMDEIPAETN